MLPKQFIVTEALWIKLGHQRLRILGQRCSEHDHLKVSTHSLQELLDSWSNKDVYLAYLTFDLNWQNNVSVFYRLELRMDKGFIQVEDQGLAADVALSLWADQPLFVFVTFWFLQGLLLLLLDSLHVRSVGSLRDLANELREGVTWLCLCFLLRRLTTIRSSLLSSLSLRLVGTTPLLLLLHLLHLKLLLLLVLNSSCVLLLSDRKLLLEHLLLEELLVKSLLFPLLLNLLFELLILVSVSHLRGHDLTLLLNASAATISSLTLGAWLLIWLVRLSHHNVVLLLLFLLCIIIWLLFILLVTDISMGIIFRLLEISCLALILGRLRVHWVPTSLDVWVLDAQLARVYDRHAVAGRWLSNVVFVASTALGLDLELGLLWALRVATMMLLRVVVPMSLGQVLTSVWLEGEASIVLLIIGHCVRLVKTLLVFHMNLLGVHF